MVWEITPDELWFRYADGERDFPGIKLIQSEKATSAQMIELQGFDLRGINLRGAYLRYADLSSADLTGADLSSAVLIEACLERATVRDASLYSANLHWCSLAEANLGGTSLGHMNATNAFFCGAKNIDGFEYTILADANFRGANISRDVLYAHGNLLWNTTAADGGIICGPLYGDGKRILHE